MTLFTDDGAAPRFARSTFVWALLGAFFWQGTASAEAGEPVPGTTIEQLQRFDFTGAKQLPLGGRDQLRQATAGANPGSGESSGDRQQELVAHGATSINGRSDADASQPGDVASVTVITRPHADETAGASVRPAGTSSDVATAHADTKDGHTDPILTEGLSTNRSPVHTVSATPGHAAASPGQENTGAPTETLIGRIIDVPPLPDRYERPAGQAPKKVYRRRYRARRASNKVLAAKNAKPKPKPIGDVHVDWRKRALFFTN